MELNNNYAKKQRSYFTVFFSIIILVFAACTDDPLKVGMEMLQGDTLYVNQIELPVELYTISGIPVKTRSVGKSPLGSINDPLFGQLKTDFVTNIMYSSSSISFKDQHPDSMDVEVYELELLLKFRELYGDINDIDFDVYELIEDLPANSTSDFEIDTSMISDLPINIGKPERTNDSSFYFTVKLSHDYANKFINPQLLIDSAYEWNIYSDSDHYKVFRNAIKGLYFATKYRGASDFGGGIITINHDSSKLVLRTIEKRSNGTLDTIDNNFSLASIKVPEGAHINSYKYNGGSQILSVLDNTSHIFPNAYVQSLAGPRVLIKIPDLQNLKQQFNYTVVINKAELVLPVNQELTDPELYKVPELLGVKDVATDSSISDDGYITYYMGGSFDKTNYEYRINIANHLHDYMYDVTGTEVGNQLYLFGANLVQSPVVSSSAISDYSFRTAGRVVLTNRNTSTPPVLRIIYSKIPN